jgi:hypothetical protein
MAEKQPLEIASEAIRSAEKEDHEDASGSDEAWLNAYMDAKAATRLAFAALAALESAGFVLVAKEEQQSFPATRIATNVRVQISSS